MRRNRRSAATREYVMEHSTIDTMFDLTDTKRERLFELTRGLASVLHVNATRRVITIQFKNFHSETEKKRDLKMVENLLRQLAVQ